MRDNLHEVVHLTPGSSRRFIQGGSPVGVGWALMGGGEVGGGEGGRGKQCFHPTTNLVIFSLLFRIYFCFVTLYTIIFLCRNSFAINFARKITLGIKIEE